MADKAQDGFKIEEQSVAGKDVVILDLRGELDAYTTKALQAAISELFMARRHRLIVDLARVSYVSSAGVSLFIEAQNEARGLAGDVVLLAPSTAVRNVLELLGLSTQFRIAETREDAIAALCK
jgi:anti-sigma B factor antagonist